MNTSPVRIGYSLSLSGALASNGKTAHQAHQIWQENVNKGEQLLGRPVDFVCLDDQTNSNLVADLYHRLLDISEFKKPNTEAVVYPPEAASANLVYPYERARP